MSEPIGIEETPRSLFIDGVRHGERQCHERMGATGKGRTYVCPGCQHTTCWCNGTSETEFCDGCTVLMWGRGSHG